MTCDELATSIDLNSCASTLAEALTSFKRQVRLVVGIFLRTKCNKLRGRTSDSRESSALNTIPQFKHFLSKPFCSCVTHDQSKQRQCKSQCNNQPCTELWLHGSRSPPSVALWGPSESPSRTFCSEKVCSLQRAMTSSSLFCGSNRDAKPKGKIH